MVQHSCSLLYYVVVVFTQTPASGLVSLWCSVLIGEKPKNSLTGDVDTHMLYMPTVDDGGLTCRVDGVAADLADPS